MMFENCREPNDYIEEIFKLGLIENYSKILNSTEIGGYYVGIPSRDKKEISKLSQWERLFVNIKTKSRKVYGETDTENTFAQCLLWAYEELLNIITDNNDLFPVDGDIKTLLEEREKDIAPYILTCVDLKLKTYISSKKNPNYIVSQKNGKRKFEKVDFYYLDDDKVGNRYNVLEEAMISVGSGEITEYLLEALLKSNNLTKKQRQYVNTILSDDHYVEGSKVYNLDGEIVYNCNQYFFFNRQLAKELARIIDNNECLIDNGDRIVFR